MMQGHDKLIDSGHEYRDTALRSELAITNETLALGGSIPAAAASWIPGGLTGYLPVQAYLYSGTGEFLLIDTGLGVHRDSIAASLDRHVGTKRTGRLLMTRREPDAIINLPWIASRYRLQRVLAGGELDPLDYFESMDVASTYALMRATMSASFTVLNRGAVVTFEERSIEFLHPPLKVLTTNWFFDRESGTLYSSDSWACITSREPVGPFVATPDEVETALSPEGVFRYLATKFDWLRGIDTEPIADDVKRLFDERDIRRICPSSGGIIDGRDAVAAVRSATLQALRDLARSNRIRVCRDLDRLTNRLPQAEGGRNASR